MTKNLPTKPNLKSATSTTKQVFVDQTGNIYEAQKKDLSKALGIKTIEEKIEGLFEKTPNSNSPNYITNEEIAKSLHKQASGKSEKITRYNQENSKDILEILNQVIDFNPRELWAHYDRGQILFDLEKYEEAASELTKELELHIEGPGVFRPYFDRAWCNIEMNKINLAAQDFRKYKEFDLDREIRANFVKELQSTIDREIDKLHQEVRAKFAEADHFRFLPSEEVLKFEKENNLTNSIEAKYLASLELFNKLIESDPERLWAHYDRGINLMRLGRSKEANSDFTKELEINDSQHCQKVCRYEKAMSHYLEGEFAEAKTEFNNLLQIQDESEDKIFKFAQENLEEIESYQKAAESIKQESQEGSNYYKYFYKLPHIYFGMLLFAGTIHAAKYIVERFILPQPINQNEENLNHFYEEDIATGNTKFHAREMFDSFFYEEFADYLVENFHKLPRNFFQVFSKSNNDQELRLFLDEQEFLSAEIKDNLVETFVSLKKLKQDQPLNTFQFRFPKNYLYDTLLRNSDSQNHPKDPDKMARAIKDFEDEVSKHFYEICENVLRNEKIKPLLDELASEIEAKEEFSTLQSRIKPSTKPLSSSNAKQESYQQLIAAGEEKNHKDSGHSVG